MSNENRRLRAARLREDIRAGVREPSRHDLYGYRQGCVCDVCRAANREHHASYRKDPQARRLRLERMKRRKKAVRAGLIKVRFHNHAGYVAGCLCQICSDASAQYSKQWRARKKAELQGHDNQEGSK